ncbi:MAG TPA: hypothetical protein VEC18_02735, partial [Myxococcota bacterium]|nr:hypothetical protein [Myxococcota bacterium]
LCLSVLALAGFMVGAGAALSADAKVECSVMENGKPTTKLVASREECKRLGGKVIEPVSSEPRSQ